MILAREKFQTLTEQMFYILLCLQEERCGVDMMEQVKSMTNGRITIGAGTMYTLLDNFVNQGYIQETNVENRRKSYIITQLGADKLEAECARMALLIQDYRRTKKEDDHG